MTKNKTLQARLARSLDQMNKREAKNPAHVPPALLPAKTRKCKKLCISLFKTDLDKLDGIRSFMKTHGRWISASHAIKLALRTAQLNTALAEAMAAILAEDGRTEPRG